MKGASVNLKIKIVILTYNGLRWVEKCIASLYEAGLQDNQILVVDNASMDGTAEFIRVRFPATPIIENFSNLGFAGGCNVGIRHALASDSEFIFLLNQDTAVAPDCFMHIAEVLRKTDPAVVMAPLQLRYDGSGIDPSMRVGLLTDAGEFIDDLWRGTQKLFYPLEGAYGGALMFHRRVFEAVGLLDECFFLYGEDEDLIRRIRRAGFPVWLVPGALVYHWHTLVQEKSKCSAIDGVHVRRAKLILALKDMERSWMSRFLYAFKTLLTQSLHAAARLDGQGLRRAFQDAGWFLVNAARVKRSRDSDKQRLVNASSASFYQQQ